MSRQPLGGTLNGFRIIRLLCRAALCLSVTSVYAAQGQRPAPLRLEFTISPQAIQSFGRSFQKYLYSWEGRQLIYQTVFQGQRQSFNEIGPNEVRKYLAGYRRWMEKQLKINPDTFDKTMPPLQISVFYPQWDIQVMIRQRINDAVCIISQQLGRGVGHRVTKRWCQGRGLLYGAYNRVAWNQIFTMGPEMLYSVNADLARSVKVLGRAGSIRFAPASNANRSYALARGSFAQLIAPQTKDYPMQWVTLDLSQLDKKIPALGDWIATNGLSQLKAMRSGQLDARLRAHRPLVKGELRLIVVAGGFGSCLEAGQNPLDDKQSDDAIHPERNTLARNYLLNAPHRAGDTILFSCFDLSVSGNTIRYQLADFDGQGNLRLRSDGRGKISFTVGKEDQLQPAGALAPFQNLIEKESRGRSLDLIGHSFGGGLVTYLAKNLAPDINLGTLATLDPVSFLRCQPQAFVSQKLSELISQLNRQIKGKPNLIQALSGVEGLLNPTHADGNPLPGCTHFPPEYGEADISQIASHISDRWYNAFEQRNRDIHSGAIPEPPPNAVNQEITDLNSGTTGLDLPGMSPHIEIMDSAVLWNSLRPFLLSAASGQDENTAHHELGPATHD